MDPSPGFPPEILDSIATLVANRSSSEREIVGDLKACRLVNRAFARIFDQYLFYSGGFTDLSETDTPLTCRRAETLLDILTRRPHLASHIRKFTLRIGSASCTDPSVPLILDRLRTLECLEVNAKAQVDQVPVLWVRMAIELRESIMRVGLEGEALQELVLDGIWEIPAVLIFGSQRLTRISLLQVTVEEGNDGDVYSSEHVSTAPVADGQAAGAKLDLDLSLSMFDGFCACLSRLPDPGKLFRRLRSLKLLPHNMEDESHVRKILEMCGQYAGDSLEEIDTVTFGWFGTPSALSLIFCSLSLILRGSLLPSGQMMLPPVKRLPSLRKLAVAISHPVGLDNLRDAFKEVDVSKLEELHVSFVHIAPYDELVMDMYLNQAVSLLVPLLEGAHLPGRTPAGKMDGLSEGGTKLSKFQKMVLTFQVGEGARSEELGPLMFGGKLDQLLARTDACVQVMSMANPGDCLFYYEHDEPKWRE